jgi:transcriptional regulator with XRE-family HTH domain
VAEIPWDFARHYCDTSYKPRVEAIGLKGRETLGARLREMRLAAGATQEELASAAGIGRVTLARIELGEQSPRYETLVALSSALGKPFQDLVAGSEGAPAFIREERARDSFGAGKLHEKTAPPRQRKRAAQVSRKAPSAKKKS